MFPFSLQKRIFYKLQYDAFYSAQKECISSTKLLYPDQAWGNAKWIPDTNLPNGDLDPFL